MTWTALSSLLNPWEQVPMTDGGKRVVLPIDAYIHHVAEVAAKRDCVSRRHHYVPQSYLRAWSPDRKRVRVLDTRNGLDKLRGLRDTCVQENFYRVTGRDNQQHNQVEAMLAVIDDEMARLLRMLRAWAPGDDVRFEDFMSLAVVMNLQRNRTPQARRLLADLREWYTRRAGLPHHEFTTEDYVGLLFENLYHAADQLSTRQLELWDDPQGRFITCDQPVLLSDAVTGSPARMDNTRYVWWPISPSRLVALSLDPQGRKVAHRIADRKDVDKVRSAFIRGAESAIIVLPGDRDVPSGKWLQRRSQVRVECAPVDAGARRCGLTFASGYGAEPLDRACRPLCPLAVPRLMHFATAEEALRQRLRGQRP